MADGPDKTPSWVLASRERWRSRFFTSWGAIGMLALLALVGILMWRVRGALAPFVVAAIITFLLKGPVAWLAKRSNISRGWSTGAIYLAAFVAVGVLAAAFAPALGRQLTSFAITVPRYVNQAEGMISGLQAQYNQIQWPGWFETALTDVFKSVGALFVRLANGAANIVLIAGSGVVTGVFDFVLALVIAFWIIKDLPKMIGVLEELAGPRYGDDLDKLIETVNFTVGGYLRGQTISSAATGVMAGIGLALLGVPYALLLAVITFFFNYVPYIGPVLTGLIAGVIGAFHGGPLQGLAAVAIVIAAQQVTDNFIGPRVMSDQVDLHPTLVIFSLLVGASLFGIFGMLVAIPVAATAKGLFVYYWDRREHHPLSGPSALIKPETAAEEPAEGT